MSSFNAQQFGYPKSKNPLHQEEVEEILWITPLKADISELDCHATEFERLVSHCMSTHVMFQIALLVARFSHRMARCFLRRAAVLNWPWQLL